MSDITFTNYALANKGEALDLLTQPFIVSVLNCSQRMGPSFLAAIELILGDYGLHNVFLRHDTGKHIYRLWV
jgi:hypothetical protein